METVLVVKRTEEGDDVESPSLSDAATAAVIIVGRKGQRRHCDSRSINGDSLLKKRTPCRKDGENSHLKEGKREK